MCKVEKFIEPTPYKFNQRPIYYAEDENGCFNCVSHRLDRDGYPKVDRGGREWQMNRYIYVITNQVSIPPGMEVCHSCDNPTCINPDHLELGTHAENMRHKKKRNRIIKKRHKLTETEIEKLGESELTIKELALVFNVSHSTVVKKKATCRIKSDRKRALDKPSIPGSGKLSKRKTQKVKVSES